MRTMWRLFVGDLRRLRSNVVSVICVIGLVAIPSLFAWFNIAASWDPFGNLGNLRFAVANEDAGYKSDLLPMRISVGNDVVDELRADSELDWVFVPREKAIEGTRSGEYYAALVIPKDFSKRMMTFFSPDAEHATIEYYRNEKLSALAPTITGEGADEVSERVNHTFVSAMVGAALSLASSLADVVSTPQATKLLDSFVGTIGDTAGRLTDASRLLDTYRSLTDSAQTLLAGADDLLGRTSHAVGTASGDLDGITEKAGDVTGAISSAADTLSKALADSAKGFGSVGDDLDGLFDTAGASVDDIDQGLRQQADAIGAQADAYRGVLDTLVSLRDGIDAGGMLAPLRTVLDDAIAKLRSLLDTLGTLQGSLTGAADTLRHDADAALSVRDQATGLVTQATETIRGLGTDFGTTITPQVKRLVSDVTGVADDLGDGAGRLVTTIGGLQSTARSAGKGVNDLAGLLSDMSGQLSSAGSTLADYQGKLSAALAGGDMGMVKQLLGSDPSRLAASIAAPVSLTRHALFPVANFGSTMTPYYTFIPLWTASLLAVMTINPLVSRRRRAALGDPRPHRLFLGHFGIYVVVSLLQSTVSCVGSLLFLRVQAVHPLLFLLSGWLAGIVFMLFAYTLVVSFGNIGKAIGMLLLVFQVSGSAGSYPTQVLPGFMQWLSPFLPITHAIEAMRASIAGVYAGDYWRQLGLLLLFVPPLLLVGLLLRKPLRGFNRWIASRLASTQLIG